MPNCIMFMQCFPPLLKQAGGVSKCNLAMARGLIALGYKVTLMTPVDIKQSKEKEVDEWLESGQLVFMPVPSARIYSKFGIVTLSDMFDVRLICALMRELSCGQHDFLIADDIVGRIVLGQLCRAFGVPCITTTHTDMPSLEAYQKECIFRVMWKIHIYAAHFFTVHSTVSQSYKATFLKENTCVPVNAVWPPVFWSKEFKKDPEEFVEKGRKERERWVDLLGFQPRAILLFAGRWSSEKRIHLCLEVIPEGCALVIVGDGDNDYADMLVASKRRDVLPLRRSLNATEMRTASTAADFMVSASDFETFGNVIAESLSAELMCCVQPAKGHLELVQDNKNSYFVDFDDAAGARARMTEIVEAKENGSDKEVRAGLHAIGVRLRHQDWPAEVRDTLVDVAKDVASKRWCILEPLVRLLIFIVFILNWVLMWLIFRPYYRMSACISGGANVVKYVAAGTAVEPKPVTWVNGRMVDEPNNVDQATEKKAVQGAELKTELVANAV